MTKSSTKWIKIAKQVSINPFVKIPCPDCGEKLLHIHIIPWEGDESKVDVHMVCPNCDSRNTITKKIVS